MKSKSVRLMSEFAVQRISRKEDTIDLPVTEEYFIDLYFFYANEEDIRPSRWNSDIACLASGRARCDFELTSLCSVKSSLVFLRLVR